MTILAKLLGWFSLAVFLAALGLHVAGYVPGVQLAFDQVWWLAVAVLACFVAMAAHWSLFDRAAVRKGQGEGDAEPWLLRRVPRWVWTVLGALFVYALASTAAYFATNEGRADIVKGKYVLTTHGRVVREVSEQEWQDARRLQVRGVSGLWLVFTAIPAAYFLVVYPRARAALAAPEEPQPA